MDEDAFYKAYARYTAELKALGLAKRGTSFLCFKAGFKYAEKVLPCTWHGPCVHGYAGKLPNGECNYRECGCVELRAALEEQGDADIRSSFLR